VFGARRAFLVSYGSRSNRSARTLSTSVLYGVGSVTFGAHQATLNSALLVFFNGIAGGDDSVWKN
jgi:hypothetical protein